MLIYKNYNQEALDRQYNNRLNVPHFATYLDRWEVLSRETERMFPCIKDLRYGQLPREQLDVYPSTSDNATSLVFIHGGYWQLFEKSLFQFIARAFQPYGITTVIINYPLAPADTLDQMVSSCRKAIHWVYQNHSQINGDRDRIFVAGHSAGAHLAAMLMETDWAEYDADLPAGLVKGIVGISGIFNLTPIRLSYLNGVLNLDDEAAIRNSPVRINPGQSTPMILAVGAEESEEFKDQSRELYLCRKAAGFPVQLLQLPEQNHFSILESMLTPHSPLFLAIKEMMSIDA
ncbi:alpha/beta hydrolase [Segetibacter sp. 3557_3]|uniref:alpha/beta hydrolase n=1 Tax=Segetibacter sp. 3557_3 TaxID=2547429 RepID=UPI00105877CB|nr:alpha/beta hydrolase [Segetibacter sp. 3557_3]TDH17920.1 alpha/beta hydrolase [Segetibacter sp. 3557_3]